MAANVVDEIVVELKLDASQYQKTDKEVDQLATRTEKKRKTEDDASKKRDQEKVKRSKEQQKQMKEAAATAKTLAIGLRSLALGIAGAFGFAGPLALSALVDLEQGLRRTGVSTGQSNRELQAWGSAARRLGADADAGRQAIADLAREQQQFNVTGQAPTLQAFARLGIRATPETPIQDILSQAQQKYRQATPAQQRQIESGLSAQGVSGDLILMIKSEKDVRAEFARSFAESATENRKALDALSDALESVKNSAINVANALATSVQPYVEKLGTWLNSSAANLSSFSDRVANAGGGLHGLAVALRDETSTIGKTLRTLGESLEILNYIAHQIADSWKSFRDYKPPGAQRTVGEAVDLVKEAVGDWWNTTLGKARRESEGLAPGEEDVTAQMPRTFGKPRAANAPQFTSASNIMSELITQYGLNVQQAAAIAANLQGESSYQLNAFNDKGGGTGARGLGQWRGPRTAAFQKRYGILPDQATQAQQIEFMMTDPHERALVNRALGGGGDVATLSTRFSDIYEAHGNAASTAARAALAPRLAREYSGPDVPGGGNGTTINIQNVAVQADNAQQFVGSIQRVNGLQNYQSGNR